MPAYHSKIDGAGADEACGCALLPLKTKLRGPAPAAPPEGDDIIDETIKYFRPNCLFRNFDVSKSSDRTLVYLTLSCLLYTSPSPRDQRGSRMPSSA